ncbi:MAG: SprB repeat-containing protein [Bacteroidetes bacterium]|nr:SprB repeat-containing protein [Bacteroidota bacterium]
MDTNPAKCYGLSNGEAIVGTTGGNYPYTNYNWSPSSAETDSSVNTLAAGMHKVIVTDTKGCKDTLNNIVITQPDTITLSFTKTDALCKSTATGKSKVTAVGGNGAYTYLWTNGSTADSAVSLAAGTYSVTVRDAKLCQKVGSIIITEPTQLIGQTNLDSISCFGLSNGKIVLNSISGGVKPYTYLWNTIPAQTDSIADNIPAGIYTITITDKNLCSIQIKDTLKQPLLLRASGVIDSVLCFGNSNGKVDINNVSGGNKGYSYKICNGIGCSSFGTAQSNSNFVGLPTDWYTVRVTDMKGCIKDTSFQILQPALLTAERSVDSVTCFGLSTGTIALKNVRGGNKPYAYNWNTTPAQSDSVADNVPIGIYTTTITDAKGCIFNSSDTVRQPLLLQASGVFDSVICKGGSTGTIFMNAVSGGNNGYNYRYCAGAGCSTFGIPQASSTLINLAAGQYTVRVTYLKGCIRDTNFTMLEPDSIRASFNITSAKCIGNPTGRIQIASTGGNGIYLYQICEGINCNSFGTSQLVNQFNNLKGDSTYHIRISDQKGCFKIYSVFIPSNIYRDSLVQDSVRCFDGSNGSIRAYISGGDPLYIYQSCAGQNCNSFGLAQSSNTFVNLTSGWYKVKTTDVNGCVAIDSIEVLQPQKNELSIVAWDSVKCFGESNGWAKVNVTGGTGNHWYAKCFGANCNTFNNYQTLDTMFNLKSGNYMIHTKDIYNCSDTIAFEMKEPLPLQISALADSISCIGGADGKIFVNAQGGNQPYYYDFCKGKNCNTFPSPLTADSFVNLSSDFYSLYAKDSKGCEIKSSIFVPQPTISNALLGKKDESCVGTLDGKAWIKSSGSNSGWSYVWSNAVASDTIVNLVPNIYRVTSTDMKGCTRTDSIEILPATEMAFKVNVVGNQCPTGANGIINLLVNRGKSPYTYLWSNGETKSTNSNLIQGDYSITVTDANGCLKDTLIKLPVGDLLRISEWNAKDVSCYEGKDGIIDVRASGGSINKINQYLYSFDKVQWQSSGTFTNLKNSMVDCLSKTPQDVRLIV